MQKYLVHARINGNTKMQTIKDSITDFFYGKLIINTLNVMYRNK